MATLNVKLSIKKFSVNKIVPVAEILDKTLNTLCDINENLYHLKTNEKEETKPILLKTLVSLKDIDKQLCKILEVEENVDEEMESNFGMCLKIDLAKENLNTVKNKLENMRREWYLQEEHINKILNQVKESQQDIDYQSVFTIQQSLVLSRMLWNSSKFNHAVEYWATNRDNNLENVMQVVDACIYALVKVYEDEPPNANSDEYNLVIALCGIISNIASIPDGRHYITSSHMSQQVYDMMIWSLSTLSASETDDLKWIMLICIHNLIINKRGLQYAKEQQQLIQALGVCIMPSHSRRIIGISMHILRTLTEEITDPMYAYLLVKGLPMEALQNFCTCKEDSSIVKDSKVILSKLIEIYEACKARAEQFAQLECPCNDSPKQSPSIRIRTKINYNRHSAGSVTTDSTRTSISSTGKTQSSNTSATTGASSTSTGKHRKRSSNASTSSAINCPESCKRRDSTSSKPLTSTTSLPTKLDEKIDTAITSSEKVFAINNQEACTDIQGSAPSSRKPSLSQPGKRRSKSSRTTFSDPKEKSSTAVRKGSCVCSGERRKSTVEELYRNENAM